MLTFVRLFDRFRKDKRGNIAVIFAIACVPLISAIGCAIDYSEATRVRSKLQSAADAAAVASISQQSSGWKAASLMIGNGEVASAETDARNIFNGNVTASSSLYNGMALGATVTKTGANLTAKVTFSANVPVTFMKVVGFQQLTVTGSSSASASLPLYLDVYVMLDVSGSMGLPSTDAEQSRLALVNPDDFTVYPKGCTFACHFQSSGSCSDPSQGQKANAAGVTSPINSAYPTNNYCLGYLITRVSQSGYQALLQTTTKYPMKNQQFPPAILQNLTSNVTPGAPNSLLTGNSKSSLTAVTSCPTPGTDACIQLRADAVGTALNATMATQGVDGLFATANKSEIVPNQFRIGLYPFIQNLITYSSLTYNINASPNAPGTINYAAANLATLLVDGI